MCGPDGTKRRCDDPCAEIAFGPPVLLGRAKSQDLAKEGAGDGSPSHRKIQLDFGCGGAPPSETESLALVQAIQVRLEDRMERCCGLIYEMEARIDAVEKEQEVAAAEVKVSNELK